MTTEKQLDWLDVLGGDNPFQAYKKMNDQREVQAWFGGGVGPTDAAREGAPLPPPPVVAPGGGKVRPVVAADGPEGEQQQVVTYAVRPKPAGGGRGKKEEERGRKRKAKLPN